MTKGGADISYAFAKEAFLIKIMEVIRKI